MSKEKAFDVIGIIERAKKYLKIRTDTELATLLNIKQNTVSAWRKRGNIDLISVINLCANVSTDWLIYGKGSPEDGIDPVTKKILTMLEGMDEEQKRDVLRYVKKEKLLEELLKKYDEKAA